MTPSKKPKTVIPFKRHIEFTSQASRKRSRPTCSMASLENVESEAMLESDFVGLFNKASENHFTWGKTEVGPIYAKKRRAKGPKMRPDPRWLNDFFSRGINTADSRLPNGPERSFFLRFPLEVREGIYKVMLLYKFPIIVKSDLSQVESYNLRCIPILRVCRQIMHEAVRYLYQNNVFRAVLRKPLITYHLNESFIIDSKFLPFMRNVIIEGNRQSYSLEWYGKATECIEKLVQAKSVLQSLTIVVVPTRVRSAMMNSGFEKAPFTLTNFFWPRGELLQALSKLTCKFFNIIIKKQAVVKIPKITLSQAAAPSGEADQESAQTLAEETVVMITRRFLITLDLTYLQLVRREVGPVTNEVTLSIAQQRRTAVLKELMFLQRRVENVCINHDRAIEDGLCRQMEEHERIANGLTLATGRSSS